MHLDSKAGEADVKQTDLGKSAAVMQLQQTCVLLKLSQKLIAHVHEYYRTADLGGGGGCNNLADVGGSCCEVAVRPGFGGVAGAFPLGVASGGALMVSSMSGRAPSGKSREAKRSKSDLVANLEG